MDWQSVIQFVTQGQLFWLSLTVLVYWLAARFFKRSGHNTLFHPIIIPACLIGGTAALTQTSALEYQHFVSPINWLLGPVTVALAIPLYQQVRLIITTGSKAILVILIGGSIAPVIAIGWLGLFNFSQPIKLSVLTKSISTPLAVDTATIIGGVPELAAAVVVFTGILGVLFSQIVFKWVRCYDPRAQGLALGTVSHAIGTARAYQLGAKTGAFSTMALCINGILTAIILPVLFILFG